MPTKYSPSPAPAKNAGPSSNGPVKTLRIGRIKAAIWQNGADERTFFNVTFARTFMTDDKQLRDTDSFGRDDLLTLGKLADQAHTFICERAAEKRNGDEHG